jgi:Fur family peroxide stress response transcriptional regulator
MLDSYEKIREQLMEHEVKPSYNRIKILEYLMKNRDHPTADDIYVELKKELPTLSKATVYNSINAFTHAGLVKVLNMEGNESRYDPVTSTHGHFHCEQCGSYYDFKISVENLRSDDLAGFAIKETDVYLRGICKKCLGGSK